MKIHSTNYENTFIEIAEDSPAASGQVPPNKGDKKSIANHQFELLNGHPYQYTSDDILFGVFATRNDIVESEQDEERQKFFSKGQACLRASPLTKQYGWGIHSDKNGKVAMYAAETEEYQQMVSDPSVKKVKAMRSKRK